MKKHHRANHRTACSLLLSQVIRPCIHSVCQKTQGIFLPEKGGTMDSRRSRYSLLLGMVPVVLGIFLCGTALAFPGETTRVSVASDGTQGNRSAGQPKISADGRFVAFTSDSINLVPGIPYGFVDVFVRDRLTGTTSRVSVASDGTQGTNGSSAPAISADGRFVAFNSFANNLVTGDTNGTFDIFVHDRLTGQTTRVSVASDTTEGNGSSQNPSISADGRFVSFESNASNLVGAGNDNNGRSDIFVHDRLTGITTRVSVTSEGTPSNGGSFNPSISADGRYVAFVSDAQNLGNDNDVYFDVFVHDRVTGETTRASVDSSGNRANNSSGNLTISADGRFVAFDSLASNLVENDTNGLFSEVFVHDRQTGITTRVSVASDGTQSNGISGQPSISADGRFVVFYSEADNLVPDDIPGSNYRDIFVHDRLTGTTSRISVASDGTQANGNSDDYPSISADGSFVAFQSEATNLVGQDNNGYADILVHQPKIAWYRGELFQADLEEVCFTAIVSYYAEMNEALPMSDAALNQCPVTNEFPRGLPNGDFIGYSYGSSSFVGVFSGRMFNDNAVVPFRNNYVQVKRDHSGQAPSVDFVPDPNITSNLVTVSWQSASEQANNGNGEFTLQDGFGNRAFRLFYNSDGNLCYGNSAPPTCLLLSGPYVPNVANTFSVVVNLDNGSLSLYRDGQSYINGPFLDSGFSGIGFLRFSISGDNTVSESYAIDNIKMYPGADFDGDGVADSADNCPSDYNPDQSDVDHDGFGDACDICPTAHDPQQFDKDGDYIGDACDVDADNDGVADKDAIDTDGDGDPDSFGLLTIAMEGDACPRTFNPAPQFDSDDDRIFDSCDNCPSVANADQIDSDGDGVGDACEAVTVPETEKPSSSPTPPPDSDGDGIADTTDNCPSVANANQLDSDGDGIGDACDVCVADPNNDADGDGICSGVGFASPKLGDRDNCPVVANADQANLDGDGFGNACDTDADGDGYLAISAGGNDCNDLDVSVSPGRAEIPGNGKDDDCNAATPDSAYAIVFSGTNYATWLPTAGGPPVQFVATVVGPGGSLPNAVTFTQSNVTHYPGAYTNDDAANTDEDIAWSSLGNTLTLTPLDYGGSITIHAMATVTGVGTVSADFTLPKDSDGDGLPDAWENLYGNLDRDGDIDTAEGNPYQGDGLTNFEEYRGFVWKQLVEVPVGGQIYKTLAYVPASAPGHFRTHPKRKDLFVAFTGYDATDPFAIGAAFQNAGIDVHAMEATLVGTNGESNIHVLSVNDERVYPYPFTDGHINKRGIRDWSWDTKGSTDRLGDAGVYGLSTTYQMSLNGYFGDRPYQNKSPGTPALDPISAVEDKNDNGTDDKISRKYESSGTSTQGTLDGDLVVIGSYTQQLTAFDVDANGLVELPVAGNPTTIDRTHEYTREQVLKHTITHEMGHAVGMPHNSDATCLMYEYSNDWSRDGAFSAAAKAQAQIHN